MLLDQFKDLGGISDFFLLIFIALTEYIIDLIGLFHRFKIDNKVVKNLNVIEVANNFDYFVKDWIINSVAIDDHIQSVD